MSQEPQTIQTPFLDAIKKNTGLTIAAGVGRVLMGIFAMASPYVAGKSLVVIIGILLLIGGVSHLLFGLMLRGGLFSIILGILTVIAGGYMVSNPASGLGTLTIFLAAYLIVSGVFEMILAFQIKPAQGWGWELFNGVLSVILGLMIWNQYPLSGEWAIGILIGIKLFFSGMTLLMFGMAARSVVKNLHANP